jgi:protocatechuate 3,4-dioxygenase beta subunit
MDCGLKKDAKEWAMDEPMYAARDWGVQPPYLHEAYQSTVLRSPQKPLVPLPGTLSELTGPVYGHDAVKDGDDDLTRNAVVNGEPLGERIVVSGRVLDEDDKPIPDTLVEVWQANAAGRYIHGVDQHDAPLDPNFLGAGRCATDAEGRYRFITIRPGEYPWQNHDKAFRPAHIHFALMGPGSGLRHPPGDADVFPGRSPFGHRSHFPRHSRRGRAPAIDREIFGRRNRGPMGAGLRV